MNLSGVQLTARSAKIGVHDDDVGHRPIELRYPDSCGCDCCYAYWTGVAQQQAQLISRKLMYWPRRR
jgi:hypothetical protein